MLPVATAAEMRALDAATIEDIGLPGADGYAVARELRSDGPKIPPVALTGYGQPEDRQRARDAGFDSHLTKPAVPVRLLDLIDELTAPRD